MNDGTLYLAHFLGTAGAIKLLKADPATPVGTVADAKAIAANLSVLKGTAGDVSDWAYRKMGGAGPVSTTNTPRRDDLDAALARVDALELPAALKEKVRAEVVDRVNMDRRLLEAKQSDAANTAWTYALGPTNTSFRSVPAALWASVSPTEQRGLMEAFRHNADGTNAPANPYLYIDLSDKAAKGTLTSLTCEAPMARCRRATSITSLVSLRTSRRGHRPAKRMSPP